MVMHQWIWCDMEVVFGGCDGGVRVEVGFGGHRGLGRSGHGGLLEREGGKR